MCYYYGVFLCQKLFIARKYGAARLHNSSYCEPCPRNNHTMTCEPLKPSPKYITDLKFNEVFVFGSNLEGRHGKGAAKQALKWGAVYGQGIGYYGRTYAIPTRKWVRGSQPTIGTPYFNGTYSIVTLSLSEIVTYVHNFISFASVHKKLIFLVTEIGCNNAGYTSKDMAPLFWKAQKLENILLPESFLKVLISSDYKLM